MNDILYCLNQEWQGCEGADLRKGAVMLAERLFAEESYVDLGCPESDEFDVSHGVFALDAIAAHFKETLSMLQSKNPCKIFTVGATCGNEAAPVCYLNEKYQGDMAVIWFDAHGDFNTPESSPSGHFHGMVLHTLLGEGPKTFTEKITLPLKPYQVFLSDARDLDDKEREYIDQLKIPRIPVDETLSERILKAGFKKIYIHLDVDVLNPDSFSDTYMPTVGGPTLSELTRCLSDLANTFEVVGIGIVEYCGEELQSDEQIVSMIRKSRIISEK